ncbi:autotransporter outer membrane beta-barrel domain-containing protein [Bartonella sp. B10]
MKKSLLLYTVSGILLYSHPSLSYASNETAAPLLTEKLKLEDFNFKDLAFSNSAYVIKGKNGAPTNIVYKTYSHAKPVKSKNLARLVQNRPTVGSTLEKVKVYNKPINFPIPAARTQSPTVESTTTSTAEPATTAIQSESTIVSSISTTHSPSTPSTPSISNTSNTITSTSSVPSASNTSSTITSTSSVPSASDTSSASTILEKSTTSSTPKSRKRPDAEPTAAKPVTSQPMQSAVVKPAQPTTETNSTQVESSTKSEKEQVARVALEQPTLPKSTPAKSDPAKSERAQSEKSTLEQPATTQAESAKLATTQTASAKPVSEQSTPVKNVEPIRIESIQAKIEVKDGGAVTQHDAKVQSNDVAVNAKGKNSIVKIVGGTVSSKVVALSAFDGGSIEATGITTTAVSTGLINKNGTINLKDSTVNVTGNVADNNIPHGIIFQGVDNASERRRARSVKENIPLQEKNTSNNVVLTNTKLFVENGVGVGIYGMLTNGEANLKDSEIRSDVLSIHEKKNGTSAHTFTLNADHSLLEGRVRVLDDSKTIFNLTNSTKWFLKANKNTENNDKNEAEYTSFGVDGKSYSNLSALHLKDSVVLFEKPAEDNYQALYVGSKLQQENNPSNTTTVYSAAGKAEIHLNSKWSSNSPVNKQKTDRVIIAGNVSGTTMVHINLHDKDKKIANSDSVWGKNMVSTPVETHGVSVIQVSGKADKNSFKLMNKYLTMNGLPYKYVLTAYAPGKSDANQNLFGSNSRDFWDFRLQNAYIDGDKKIRALLPQVANYLVMPSALFSSGISDVTHQNVMIDNMRSTMFGSENDENTRIFLSAYGEEITLSSDRNRLQYGYDADVNYAAVQAGTVLAAMEEKDITAHLGLLGTYGKLTFTPKDMEDSEKTELDKWSVTAYGGAQHNSGMYVNALLSYGSLKGNITTALIGNAAKLDGTKALSASATVGQKLETGAKDLVFEPQAQLMYQNLMFDVISDADGFKVDMGNPNQWLVRVGGRLTKTVTIAEKGSTVSFHGKLNIIKAFGDAGKVKIADTFHLNQTGSSIEGGIGVNADLSKNIVLHGGISYQHKLQKNGISGTNFSGGIRYRF